MADKKKPFTAQEIVEIMSSFLSKNPSTGGLYVWVGDGTIKRVVDIGACGVHKRNGEHSEDKGGLLLYTAPD